MWDRVEEVASGSGFGLEIVCNALACYVSTLRDADEEMRLRWILHDFGMVYQHATPAERVYLLAEEPEPFDSRWDAFLGAYAEHLCRRGGVEPPAWALAPRRYLRDFWFAGRRFPSERLRVFLTTPAYFEAHGIWFPERELEVV